MAEQPSNLDQVAAGLRANLVESQPVADEQSQKINTWIAQNTERYASIRNDSVRLTRDVVAQIIQREDQMHDTVQGIEKRLLENPQLREQVLARIADNQERLLSYDRKARIFQTFGIKFGVTHETIRHQV